MPKLEKAANLFIRNFNHFVFLSICYASSVIPNGLVIKKRACVGNCSPGWSRKWDLTLQIAGMELVNILKSEYYEKYKVDEIRFWNEVTQLLKVMNPDKASNVFESLNRLMTSLMSTLKEKRRRKLSKLIEIFYVNLENKLLNSFKFFEDFVWFKASFLKCSDVRVLSRSRDRRKRDHQLESLLERSGDNIYEYSENSDMQDHSVNQSVIVEVQNVDHQRLVGKFVSSNVVNLSRRILSESEISLLSKGLKFSPTPREFDKSQLKQDLESFGRRLRLRWFFRGNNENEQPETFSNVFRVPSSFTPKTKDAAIEVYLTRLEEELMSVQAAGSNFSNLSVAEQEALRTIKSDNSIVIKGADKGSGVVVWDKEDYLLEAECQLSDTEVYAECNSDPLPLLQNKISDVLKRIKT